MTFLSVLALSILFPVLCLGPGFFFVRKLKWRDSETFCASIALSLFMIYLAGTLIYFSQLSWKVCWLTTIGGMVMTFMVRRELITLLTAPIIRRQLKGFGVLLGVTLLMLSLIQHYSGGLWAGDWIEHALRTAFFINRSPHDTIFIGMYSLPARPPMMNIVAAYFLSHLSSTFDIYQFVFMLLNLLVFFPCVFLAGLLIKNGGRKAWLITAFFCLSPIVLENATWAWTKLLTAFFVILSLAFYLRGWRKNEPTRMIAASASMAMAMLVHYSAGPYAVALAIHYLTILSSRRKRAFELRTSLLVAVIVLATWLLWSIAFYGFTGTFASNTTATGASYMSLLDIFKNFLNSFIPHPLSTGYRLFHIKLSQPNFFGSVRDYFFLMYQTNLTMAWGLIGWVGVVWLIVHHLRNQSISVKRFWMIFVGVTVFLGILLVGQRDVFGVSQACLIPISMIGLTFLAAGFSTLPIGARYGLLLAIAIDVALGIVLQSRMQMHRIQLTATTGDPIIPITDGLLSVTAVQNSSLRFQGHVVFWGDYFRAVQPLIYAALIFSLGALLLIPAAAAIKGLKKEYQAAGTPMMISVIVLFFLGAGICSLDRVVGYEVNEDPPENPPTPLAQEQIDSFLAPRVRVVNNNPFSSQAYYELGMGCYQAGQLLSAERFLTLAFLLDPMNLPARYTLSILMASHNKNQGTHETAIAEAFLLEPGRTDRQIALVRELLRLEFELPALERLQEALRNHPDSTEIQMFLNELGGNAAGLEARIKELKGG